MYISAALLAAALLQAPPPHEAVVAERFCAAMTSGRLRAFADITASPVMVVEWSWESVRDLVAMYDCISISSYRATFDAAASTLVIDVDADGITRNAKREHRAVPPRWYLKLDAAGNVARVDDDRTRTARALLDATTDVERAAITDLTPDIARTIAIDAPHESPDAVRAAAEFLLDRNDDPETQTYVFCALARAMKRANDPRAIAFADLARVVARGSNCDAGVFADYVASELDWPDHVARLDAAVAAVDAVDDPRMSLMAAFDRGFDALAMSDMPMATRIFDEATANARRLGRKEAELNALYGHCAVAAAVNHPKAMADTRRLAALASDAGYSNVEARAWSAIGYTQGISGGIESYRNALRAAPKAASGLLAYNHAFLAVALTRNGRVAEAAAHIPLAFEALKSSPSYTTNVLWAATVVRRAEGRFKEAIDYAHAAIESNDTPLWMTWGIKHELGEMLIECGDTERGIDELRESIDLIEARRVLTTTNPMIRAQYMQNRTQIYTALIMALVSQKRYEEALEVSEQIKARAMADAVAERGQSLSLSESEAAGEKALNQRIVDLNRKLIKARNKDSEAAIRQELRAARVDLESFQIMLELRHTRAGATNPSIDAQTLAASFHGTAIEYSVSDSSRPAIAFVVRNGRIRARRLAAGVEDIEKQVKLLAQLVEQRNLNARKQARTLYKMLIAPLSDDLPRRGTLTIIPDGILWSLPFHLLRTPSGHYLLQDYAVAYAPSLSALAHSASRPRSSEPRKMLLALGDPHIAAPTTAKVATYRNLHLGALPDAKDEVRAIGRLYGPKYSTVVTGDSARESLLKRVARHYRIVHLATHGIVDDDSPLYSALVLATGDRDPDDGLLEMREISDLDLDADLVVLSACDTARGTVYPGEGVVGLSWAFLSAGCPTTVVSQWRADSRSTALLMIEFHRQLEQHQSMAEALRRAELKLLRTARYHHPFYWAPFIVVGRDDPLALGR